MFSKFALTASERDSSLFYVLGHQLVFLSKVDTLLSYVNTILSQDSFMAVGKGPMGDLAAGPMFGARQWHLLLSSFSHFMKFWKFSWSKNFWQ